MHKQVLFSLHPSTLILLFLLLAACAPAPPTPRPPSLTPTLPAPPATLTGDAAIAWQALAKEHDQLFDFWLYAQCPHEQGLFVTPMAAPEWTAVFPDTSLFRGGPRQGCATDHAIWNLKNRSVVAVRQGQTYPLHVNNGLLGSSSANNDFIAFNRLLKDSHLAVTPQNEAAIAKAAVVMMLLYDYDIFFDRQNFASPEAAPADYRLGEAQKIDEYPECLDTGGYRKVVNDHFTVGLPAWTAQEGRVEWWRVAFFQGQLSLVQRRQLGLNVEQADFETWALKQLPKLERCEKYNTGYTIRLVED